MDNILKLVSGVLVPIITLVTGYFAYQADSGVKETEKRLKEIEAQVRQTSELRAERESIQNYNIKIFEIVKVAAAGDLKQKEIARALVKTIRDEDEQLRSGMLSVLVAATPDAEFSRSVQQDLFRSQEQTIRAPQPKTAQVAATPSAAAWGNWDFDLFWCETSPPSAQQQAELLSSVLRKEGAAGRIRVRMLPAAINAQPGYSIKGYVIRAEAGERPTAQSLKEVGDRAIGQAAPGFDIQPSTQATKWYLSAFFCPARA